jgi:hypothetical protein
VSHPRRAMPCRPVPSLAVHCLAAPRRLAPCRAAAPRHRAWRPFVLSSALTNLSLSATPTRTRECPSALCNTGGGQARGDAAQTQFVSRVARCAVWLYALCNCRTRKTQPPCRAVRACTCSQRESSCGDDSSAEDSAGGSLACRACSQCRGIEAGPSWPHTLKRYDRKRLGEQLCACHVAQDEDDDSGWVNAQLSFEKDRRAQQARAPSNRMGAHVLAWLRLGS